MGISTCDEMSRIGELRTVLFKEYSYGMIPIPTTLSKQKVEEFQMLYKKHYGIELIFDEAHEKGLRLLQFMATILQLSGAYFPDRD